MNALEEARGKAEPRLLHELNTVHPNTKLEVTVQFSPDNFEVTAFDEPAREKFSSQEDWYHARAKMRIEKFHFVTQALMQHLEEEKLNPRMGPCRNTILITGKPAYILGVLKLAVITYALKTEHADESAPVTDHIALSKDEFLRQETLVEVLRLQRREILEAARQLLIDCVRYRAIGRQPIVYDTIDGQLNIIDQTNAQGFFDFEQAAGFPDSPNEDNYWVTEVLYRPALVKLLVELQNKFGLRSIQQVTRLSLRRYFYVQSAIKRGLQFGVLK